MFINVHRLKLFTKEFRKLVLERSYREEMYKNEDNRLDTFRRVCDEIAAESSYISKANVLREFFRSGSTGCGSFQGDTLTWVQMLVPVASQRVYNLQNKQMLKLFSRLFGTDQQDMQLDLEQEGDVSETLRKYFEKSEQLKPQSKSTLYLQEVDSYLLTLEQRTREDAQCDLLRQICQKATSFDLKVIIRLIKQDLRINARARHILDAFGPDAYAVYQSSRDLRAVVAKFANANAQSKKTSKELTVPSKKLNGKANKNAKLGNVQIMTPISPMLASACKSMEEALKKCPGGMYSEVKYDGERVQIHKRNMEFKFFSRNLKPVMDHKIKRFKEFIPEAFPGAGDMILDSEIILVDTVTGDLLPFGTLGAHKKQKYAQAEVCLFVFDCILFNGEDLTNLELRERREILESNIRPIKNYVQLSESLFLKSKQELSLMTAKVLKANLEGLVLKNPTGTYQPGKRGWLKVKKDYLFGGKMADTADLVVLGAWFGSGKKGGTFSIFLMGCPDPRDGLWKTVTKVHSGLDDATNEDIHRKLLSLMVRADADSLPKWLLCNRPLVPDYLAKDPKKMPVWEITGAEFTKSEVHTAGGISIRFPRITKLRDDKTAEQANDLKYLQQLFNASKNNVNVDLLISGCASEDESTSTAVVVDTKLNLTPKKRSKNNEKEEPCSSRKMKFVNDEEEQMESRNNKKMKTAHDKELCKESQKQTKLNFAANKIKTHQDEVSESKLFKGLVAYFEGDNKDLGIEQAFIANGGIVTQEVNNASFIFYKSIPLHADINVYRMKYRRSCRHLRTQWLQDSIEAKKCLPYPLYAIVLN